MEWHNPSLFPVQILRFVGSRRAAGLSLSTALCKPVVLNGLILSATASTETPVQAKESGLRFLKKQAEKGIQLR